MRSTLRAQSPRVHGSLTKGHSNRRTRQLQRDIRVGCRSVGDESGPVTLVFGSGGSQRGPPVGFKCFRANLRSSVSNPSVKEEYISPSCLKSGFPSIKSTRYMLIAALNCQALAPCRFATVKASLKQFLASDKVEAPDNPA